MRGKGVPKSSFFLADFGCAWFQSGLQKIGSQFFIIFGFDFGFLFFGVLDFVGAFWEPSWAS